MIAWHGQPRRARSASLTTGPRSASEYSPAIATCASTHGKTPVASVADLPQTSTISEPATIIMTPIFGRCAVGTTIVSHRAKAATQHRRHDDHGRRSSPIILDSRDECAFPNAFLCTRGGDPAPGGRPRPQASCFSLCVRVWGNSILPLTWADRTSGRKFMHSTPPFPPPWTGPIHPTWGG